MDKERAHITSEPLLCIGGPYAGRRFSLQNGQRFYVPVLRKTRSESGVAAKPSPAAESVAYVEQRIRTPDGDVFFFIPEGQSSRETIALLLNSYEKLATLAVEGLVELDQAATEALDG